MTVSPLARALADLYARIPLGMRLGLEPMRAACAAFGAPERAFDVVHVAGTNGKGSVCAMVERIARASGMKTGLYTSPHLCRLAERIRIDGAPLDDATLAPLMREVLDGAPDLSFFETLTLAAFVAFREAKVDIAILEVGLGGRLDATNVVPPPRASAITRIALDHTDRLGETLVEIAREKAGIAKPGMRIALGPLQADVRAAIDEVALAAGASTFAATDDADAARFAASAAVGLPGEHQRENAAVAWVLGKAIGAPEDARARGIADAEWPGRLEHVDTTDGAVLLDAAHNPDGAASLARHLRGLARPPSATALVFGTLADKAWEPMIDLLYPLASRHFYVAPSGRAPTDPAAIARRHAGEPAPSVAEAYRRARAAVGRDGLVVVAGSISLVGEARAHLLGLARDPAVGL